MTMRAGRRKTPPTTTSTTAPPPRRGVARIWLGPKTGVLVLRFPFDSEVVAAIRGLPAIDRAWVPEDRAWIVSPYWLSEVERVLAEHFEAVQVDAEVREFAARRDAAERREVAREVARERGGDVVDLCEVRARRAGSGGGGAA